MLNWQVVNNAMPFNIVIGKNLGINNINLVKDIILMKINLERNIRTTLKIIVVSRHDSHKITKLRMY